MILAPELGSNSANPLYLIWISGYLTLSCNLNGEIPSNGVDRDIWSVVVVVVVAV